MSEDHKNLEKDVQAQAVAELPVLTLNPSAGDKLQMEKVMDELDKVSAQEPVAPDVQAAIDNAVRTIVASGKAAGTLTSDAALARHYLELGCTFVATGVDILMFANGARKLAREFIAPQGA